MECFAYRVFLFDRRRSDAGKSSFYYWGSQVMAQDRELRDVIRQVHDLTRYYSSEESFNTANAAPGNWYGTKHRLRYTLFEYELHLLDTEGHGVQPHLKWEQLGDSTIEHILPQAPREDSHWMETWPTEQFNASVHDIANLVLTQDNSSYSNFEFARKKGRAGESPSYSNSDIRQERKISSYSDWTPKEFAERRRELQAWIIDRWKTEGAEGAPTLEVVDEDDEDVNVTTMAVPVL